MISTCRRWYIIWKWRLLLLYVMFDKLVSILWFNCIWNDILLCWPSLTMSFWYDLFEKSFQIYASVGDKWILCHQRCWKSNENVFDVATRQMWFWKKSSTLAIFRRQIWLQDQIIISIENETVERQTNNNKRFFHYSFLFSYFPIRHRMHLCVCIFISEKRRK